MAWMASICIPRRPSPTSSSSRMRRRWKISCARVRPGTVLVGGTTIGRSLAPRVAARLRTGLTADCTTLDIQANTRSRPDSPGVRRQYHGAYPHPASPAAIRHRPL